MKQGRQRKTFSRGVSSLVAVLLVILIGGSSAAAIDRLNVAVRNAQDAETSVTRLRIYGEKAWLLTLRYEANPSDLMTILEESKSVISASMTEYDLLDRIAPGPDIDYLRQLDQEMTSVLSVMAIKGMANDGGASSRAYAEEVAKPLGVKSDEALQVVEKKFRERADRMTLYARAGTVGIIAGASLAIVALIVCVERTRRNSTQRLERREARFRTLVEHGSDLIIVLDRNGNVTYHSQSMSGLLGHDTAELVNRPLTSIVVGSDHARIQRLIADVVSSGPRESTKFEIRLRHADGSPRTFQVVVSNHLSTPDVEGVLVSGHDITNYIELTQRLRELALFDPLTGLPNRPVLFERLGTAIANADRHGEQFAVVYLDLDGFKYVNDTLGHSAGDEVLRIVAQRMLAEIREQDTLSRVGGDEFVLLLADADDDAVTTVVERIRAVVASPMDIGGWPVEVGVSAGIAQTGSTSTVEELLQSADHAMYQDKRLRNRSGGTPVVLSAVA